jgi:hypothetical protein
MAKKMKRELQRAKFQKADQDELFEERDTELDEDEDAYTYRKRSQAPFKLKMSRRRQDMIVVIIACVLVIGTLGGYYYYLFSTTSDTSDDDTANGNVTTVDGQKLYSAELFVISDITNNWGEASWHILNYGGKTDFMLKVSNTGLKEDTFKLVDFNTHERIQIIFKENDFKLDAGISKLVIVEVSTNIDYNYRVQPSIDINLISKFTNSISDTIKIDVTVNKLDTDNTALENDKVAAYYTGAFRNGTLFDHSLKNPIETDPLHISLSSDIQMDKFDSIQYTTVIDGFKLGIIGMVPGETRVIEVPPNLGYPRDHELGGITLMFQVRLLSNDRDL